MSSYRLIYAYNVVSDDDPQAENCHKQDDQDHANHPGEEKASVAFAHPLDEQAGTGDERQAEKNDKGAG